jgi:diazepam-binding inhibitor (GABA receptor modulator, acyl-CoA-binding protein)
MRALVVRRGRRLRYRGAMSVEEDFESAQQRINSLGSPPSQDKLLQLYALYKQAKVGDATGKRPGMLDIKGRAKFDAWSKQKGKSQADAMTAYVALVDSLVS